MAEKEIVKKKNPPKAVKAKALAGAKEISKKVEGKYWQATGRRKTAVARIRIKDAKKTSFVVNQKSFEDYFQDKEYQVIAKEALERGADGKTFDVSIVVRGGGMRAQAEAVRHGLARVLVEWDAAMRDSMKTLKFLTRDPRMRERKKFGLKRARRARQWRKR
ncbi:MAG: 30S ribosomal protein S9 [bacterium]|nr:30S ribosomal protein S9 [bacterium]